LTIARPSLQQLELLQAIGMPMILEVMDGTERKKGSMGTRLVKAASIIFVAAVLSGLVYGYADYWRQFTERSRFERERASERLEKDSLVATKRRFVIGGAVGAMLGLAYVVRCGMRRGDL
jgi:hypothetical protein